MCFGVTAHAWKPRGAFSPRYCAVRRVAKGGKGGKWATKFFQAEKGDASQGRRQHERGGQQRPAHGGTPDPEGARGPGRETSPTDSEQRDAAGRRQGYVETGW